ncbi:MAG: helix-turn-helix domain-containing protein [Propionivibrio sp.]
MGNLVSAKQFADRLGVSLRTLEELIAQGRIPPHIRLGRLRRWHPEQVDTWINEQFSRVNGEKASKQPDQIQPMA